MPGNLKKSYGIICFRKSNDNLQLLMVKKSTTYHFCEFVAGRYNKHSNVQLIKLFNNMTYHEKMDILSMMFQNMWYRIYMENPDKVFMQRNQNFWSLLYLKQKNKFETRFLQDGGERLKKLIACSSNVDTPWEFPKGRKDTDKEEDDIETAIREFYEETGIDDSKYTLLWHIKPYVETYTDFGTTYQNIYYFAEANYIWEPDYKFYNKKQISEIALVKWVSNADLSHMNLEEVTFRRLLKSFQKIITKYKNGTKKRKNRSKNINIDSIVF